LPFDGLPQNVRLWLRASIQRRQQKKEFDMRRRLMWVVLFSSAIAITALYHAKKAGATPSTGFTSTVVAQGRLGDIDVANSFVPPKGRVWLSVQKSKGPSDLYVLSNVWQPGGSTGWHSHPGHTLIIVTEGTITEYEGNDPNCKPHAYTVGMGFVDPGGGHVHIVRNEGSVEASVMAVQLIPGDQMRRIDADDPGNCHFQN
jgi:quercetin dioxygenase-like cupin family protein